MIVRVVEIVLHHSRAVMRICSIVFFASKYLIQMLRIGAVSLYGLHMLDNCLVG